MEKREGCPMATVFLENLVCSEKSYGILGRVANSKPERGFDENPHERDVNCRCAEGASLAMVNLAQVARALRLE